jgi:murein DD-endopeptidase MepM/ murein hydrolase activator NlpD
MTKNYLVQSLMIAGIGLFLGGYGAYLWQYQEKSYTEVRDDAAPNGEAAVPVLPSVEELFPHVMPPNSTLNAVLQDQGFTPQTIHQIVEAAKPVANLGRLNSGVRFNIVYAPAVADADPVAIEIRFRFSATELLDVRKTGSLWHAEKIREVVDTKIRTFAGEVESSLWGSAVQAHMDPNLISELAEVFAWQIDFNREVQEGDRWRISVEQKFVRGQPIGWGSIQAAEYDNGDQKFSAVLFQINEQERGYFAPDGSNLKKMFLKSPLRYGRISSRFTTKRFHPILQINRPHLGVDYAAPVGTPIRAVGDASVEVAGTVGGAGKMIKLRHNAMYITAYKHLSGFAQGVHAGARVRQGQVIGYVGTTGLSTGPHLHFEFFQGGQYVDPLGKKFPSAEPVPARLFGQFQVAMKNQLASLPDWENSGRAELGSTQEPTH